MLILAFDTTSEKGGVGIFRDVECLALIPNEGPANRYAVTLFEMVEQALARAHRELREIEMYATANGPGSFTGIRVGLAAARAWGKAFGRRVRGVSVLEAMVNKARQSVDLESLPSPGGKNAPRSCAGDGCIPPQQSPRPDWFFPILDARRGEFFLGSFRRRPSELSGASRQDYEPAGGGWVIQPKVLRAFLEERLSFSANATCIVRAHDQAAGDLRSILPTSLTWQQIEGDLVNSIADVARKEEQSSCPSPDVKLDAYYIRRPDAEVNWKD
jgi:tRNA threonylcarbamoyl adenosine modification protein YeaZ